MCRHLASCVDTLSVFGFYVSTPQDYVSTPLMLFKATGYMCQHFAFFLQLIHIVSICRHLEIMCRLMVISLSRLCLLFTYVDTLVSCVILQFWIFYYLHVSTLQGHVSTPSIPNLLIVHMC